MLVSVVLNSSSLAPLICDVALQKIYVLALYTGIFSHSDPPLSLGVVLNILTQLRQYHVPP